MTYYAKFRLKEGFQGVLYRVEEGRRIPLCPDSSGLFVVPFNTEFYLVDDRGGYVSVDKCICKRVVDFRGWHPWIKGFNCDVVCSNVLILGGGWFLFEDIVKMIYEGVEPCL